MQYIKLPMMIKLAQASLAASNGARWSLVVQNLREETHEFLANAGAVLLLDDVWWLSGFLLPWHRLVPLSVDLLNGL